MRKWISALLVSLVWLSQGFAGGTPGKVVLETWDAAYLGGGKAGYVQTVVEETKQGGETVYRAAIKYRLQVKRFNESIELSMDVGTEETKEGKVLGVFMIQPLGKNKKLELTGKVVGKQLKLIMDGGKSLQPAPWDDQVVGLYKQQTLFRDRQVKPGDQFSFLSFEPSINLVVTTKVKVLDYETVEMFAGKSKQKLLHAQIQADPVQGFQPPKMDVWLDDKLDMARSQVTLPVGQLTLYRSSKKDATTGGAAAKLTDIGLYQLVKLNRKIVQPYGTKKAIYRVKIRDAENPEKAISQDRRQSVVNMKGDTFELHITAGAAEAAEKVGDEFLQSSYFINCEDAQVKKLAKLAAGLEKDPWKKALKIEKWVNRNMKPTNDEAMATADHVARTLKGDCSEFAMLMTALCRAEGIPAKTAMGLIYADVPGKGPAFSFHMWTEVWVQGQWQPLDATLGKGYVGATHIKITDHSWHDTRTLTPVLPLYSLLGKISIEVIQVE